MSITVSPGTAAFCQSVRLAMQKRRMRSRAVSPPRIFSRRRPEPSQAFESPLLFRHFSFWTGILGATTMLDTDAIVTTGLRPSIFDRLPTGFGDPDPTDLDRLAASLDYLALRCCKPTLDETSQKPPAEAMAEHKQLLIGRRAGCWRAALARGVARH
jgi:hypothetical protein